MGSLAPESPWLPQDDLLLMQSIEGGASLEALARGAKRFSRRFTLQELQDRWHSLLYDPVVSAEASVPMFELYCTASNTLPKSQKEARCLPGKRKSKSVRSHYYSMRKRICNDPFDFMDMDFLDGTEYCDTGNINEGSSTDHFIADNVCDPFQQGNDHDFTELYADGAASSDYGIPVSAFQSGLCDLNPSSHVTVPGDQNADENLAPYDMSSGLDMKHNEQEINTNSGFNREVLNSSTSGCGTSPVFDLQCWNAVDGFRESTLADAFGHGEQPDMPDLGDPSYATGMIMPEDGTSCPLPTTLNGQMKGSAANAEDYLMEISKSLLNDNELSFTDIDGSDLIDKACMDDYMSLLLDIPDDSLSETPVTLPSDPVETSSGAHVRESGAKELPYKCVDHHVISIRDHAFPEKRNGVICCVLNTEDLEIPNNDDVFLPFRISSMDTEFDTPCYPLASPVNTLSDNSKVSDTPMECESSYFELPCSLTAPIKPDIGLVAVKTEGPSLAGLTRCTTSRAATGHDESMLITETPNILNQYSNDSHLRFHKNGESNLEPSTSAFVPTSEAVHTEQQYVETNVPDSISDPPLSDDEEFSCDSDGDVPYCSDVEAMILDMDLVPIDDDCYSNQGVQKYESEDAKRVIMRLEQAADSCMQRAISAHKAYAVLFGRYSKHFIRKTEVILGRATEDVPVDIDLAKEIRSSTISRHQATLKMDSDGSFHLKNHGRQAILVNGAEVSKGSDVVLASGSLVEIRGASFIFEINKAYFK